MEGSQTNNVVCTTSGAWLVDAHLVKSELAVLGSGKVFRVDLDGFIKLLVDHVGDSQVRDDHLFF